MADRARLPPPPELSMPIGEAMFTQRAIRRLRSDPIGDARLERALDRSDLQASLDDLLRRGR